jgi:hypothetical protein
VEVVGVVSRAVSLGGQAGNASIFPGQRITMWHGIRELTP